MRILLIGGSKSGKSTAAQRLCRHLAAGAPLYYWATMTPRDSEDHQRVLRHIADREGWGFRTIERSTGLTAALPDIDKRGAVLLDSVTAALSEAMFGPEFDANAAETVTAELLAVSRHSAHFVALPRCAALWRRNLTWCAIWRRVCPVCGRERGPCEGLDLRLFHGVGHVSGHPLPTEAMERKGEKQNDLLPAPCGAGGGRCVAAGGVCGAVFAPERGRLADRRDLPRRQEILKDSHCGAFAVISMVLLALSQWSFAMAREELPLLPLLVIPAASRACAALAVLTLRPMTTSQYAAMTGRKTPYVVFAALVMAAAIIVPLALWGSFAPLAAAVGYWLAVWYADRQLGGMSGDVSGFALTLGELWGLAVLTLVR